MLVLMIMIKDFIEHKDSKQRFINVLVIDIFVGCHIAGHGTFLNIGGFSVTHIIALKYLTLMYAVIYFVALKFHINKHLLINWLCLIISIFMGCILLIFYHYKEPIVCALSGTWDQYFAKVATKVVPVFSSYNVNVLVHTFTLLVIALIVYSGFHREDYGLIIEKLLKLSKLVVVFGIGEVIIKDIFHSTLYNSFLRVFLGKSNSATFDTLLERGRLYRLQGLSAESSTYAFSMFICCLIFFKYRKRIWLSLSVILMMLSTAFTAIAFLGLFAVIYLLAKSSMDKNEKKKAIIWTSVIIGIFFAFCIAFSFGSISSNISFFKENEYGKRIADAFERIHMIVNNDYVEGVVPQGVQGSTFTRMISSYTTLRYVLDRPLFGYGLGTFSNFGYTSNLVSSIGIIGFVFWNSFLFYGNLKYKKTGIEYHALVVIWYAINLFNGGAVMEIYREMNLFLVMLFQSILLKDKAGFQLHQTIKMHSCDRSMKEGFFNERILDNHHNPCI